jgi:hypothetical protein
MRSLVEVAPLQYGIQPVTSNLAVAAEVTTGTSNNVPVIKKEKKVRVFILFSIQVEMAYTKRLHVYM